MHRSVAVGALIVASLGFTLATGGELSAQRRFAEMISVTEVEVPVRVLVKGMPLVGLGREDFEVYDRGVLQTIAGFETRRLLNGRQRPTPAETPGSLDDPVSRHLLLLFDFSYSRRHRLAQALEGIRAMLASRLDPTDRLAVATYGAVSGLNLLVGFTSDRSKTELALGAIEAMLDAKRERQREFLARLHAARFGKQGGTAGSVYLALRRELGPIAALALLAGPGANREMSAEGLEPAGRARLLDPVRARVVVDVTKPFDIAQDLLGGAGVSDVRAFGLSLAELASLLRDIGGQKHVILLSEGFGGELLRDSRSLYYLQQAVRSMRDAGWTLHSIDIGGVPGLGEPSFAADSLLFLAQETGGDLIENINDLSVAANRILRRTGVVYLLSFQPAITGDEGEFHQLEVRLKNPPRGVRIIHRPGYYTPRPSTEREVYEQRVDSASWLLTNLEADELEVEVLAEPSGALVRLAVEVAGRSLLAARTKRPTVLELRLLALDRNGGICDLLTADVRIDFASLETLLEQGGVRFLGELELEPGDYRLRILVRSRRGGEVFLGSFPLAVGRDTGTGLASMSAQNERWASQWLTVETERRSAYFQ